MTKSLPGVADLRLGANHPRMWTRRVQGTVVNVGVKVLPWIPTPAKRNPVGRPIGHYRWQYA